MATSEYIVLSNLMQVVLLNILNLDLLIVIIYFYPNSTCQKEKRLLMGCYLAMNINHKDLYITYPVCIRLDL